MAQGVLPHKKYGTGIAPGQGLAGARESVKSENLPELLCRTGFWTFREFYLREDS